MLINMTVDIKEILCQTCKKQLDMRSFIILCTSCMHKHNNHIALSTLNKVEHELPCPTCRAEICDCKGRYCINNEHKIWCIDIEMMRRRVLGYQLEAEEENRVDRAIIRDNDNE